MTITGKNGLIFEERFQQLKLMSLHGLIAHHFPNLFYTGLSQAGVGVNQCQRLDEQSLHVAYTIREAEKKYNGKKTVIEPTDAACEDWGNQVAGRAHLMATMANCTPSYFNSEGGTDKMTPDQQMAMARATIWGSGYLSYANILQDWRASGKLEGFEISAA